jgi:hypothetical protein
MPYFMKTHSVVLELFHAYRRTYGRGELIRRSEELQTRTKTSKERHYVSNKRCVAVALASYIYSVCPVPNPCRNLNLFLV